VANSYRAGARVIVLNYFAKGLACSDMRRCCCCCFLGSTTPSIMSQWTAAFVGRLRELGWIEGRTIKIEYRWAEGRGER
jgi:hypothetical protein